MASSNISRSVLKSLKGRSFSAAAAQAERAHVESVEKCSVKKLSNGMLVGTVPSKSPVARIAVVANAGSRFENGDNLGVSHFLRMSSRLRTENMSSLAVTRTAQQFGSDITIMGTREYIYFKSSVNKDWVDQMAKVLQELTTNQVYVPWEVSDVQTDEDGMLLDLAIYNTRPHLRAVELLHSAAFRTTLGNSLYAPDHMVGKYKPEQVLEYVKANFTAGRMALIGVGVDEAQLEEFASKFRLHDAKGAAVQQATYCGGGEIRANTGGELSYVSVGFEGPSLTSKDLLASEVLRHIMGTGPYIKYSSGAATSHLTKAVTEATGGPFFVSAHNLTYTDSGLFGFNAVSHSSQIEKVVQVAAEKIKSLGSGSITDEDVKRGKNQLKAEICMQFENLDVLLNWMGEQALNGDSDLVTPDDVCKMVDSVDTASVKAVAKKIVSSRPSIASAGNTASVPYLDKIFS